MKRFGQRGPGLLVLLALAINLVLPSVAVGKNQLSKAVQTSADYMLAAVPAPAVGAIGGEWAVIGLARSGCDVPQDYWDSYYRKVEHTVENSGGVLHRRKYTEYSRLVLALTAIGADPVDVAGYDLLAPLGDFEQVIGQGVNGPICALLALDCGGYETQPVRQRYVEHILDRQRSEGGWSLAGTSDPDLTGMALQALAKYQSQPKVDAAIQRALAYLSGEQNRNGGFDTLEGTAQVLVALCELGLGPDYAPLTKNGNTLLDGLLSFRASNGSFVHTREQSGNDQMASEQGLYALAASIRAMEGRSPLYRMDDVTICVSGSFASGLPGKHPHVLIPKRTDPGRIFSDIAKHPNRTAIEALAQRGITAGKGDGRFDPDAALTRGEFTALVVRALGLVPKESGVFLDVTKTAWYAGFVGTAHRYGIVSGVGSGRFAPDDTITRQQAAVMVTKAAALCGMDTRLTQAESSDTLSLFGDRPAVSSWAGASVAFCYRSGIWDDSEWDIQPNNHVSRGEMAQMLYNLLSKCRMLGG